MAGVHAMIVLVCLVVSMQVLAQATFNPKNIAQGSSNYPSAFQLDLSSLYNNRGFAMSPGDADFDGLGSKYSLDRRQRKFLFNLLFDLAKWKKPQACRTLIL